MTVDSQPDRDYWLGLVSPTLHAEESASGNDQMSDEGNMEDEGETINDNATPDNSSESAEELQQDD